MVWGCELDSSGLGKGPVVGFCEHGNKPLGPTKAGNFLTKQQLSSQGLCSME